MSLLPGLSQFSVDFVCLQETHVPPESECSSWFSSFGFLSLASPGSAHSCGSLLLYHPRYSLYSSFLDSVGRFFRATFSYNDVTFHVIWLYAANQDPSRSVFFQFVTDHVDPCSPTIICGDFNSVFDRTRDRRGFAAAASPQDSPGALTTLFGDCCVVDVWRHLHPHTTAFTWLRPDGSFPRGSLLLAVLFLGCIMCGPVIFWASWVLR